MVDSRESPEGPDALEPGFASATTEERIYSFLVQSREPVSAPEVAETLECSKDTARKYLEWFTELGIANKHDGRPTTYERNPEYFEWKYVTRLADTHTLEELQANILDLRTRLSTLREQYDTDDPSTVDLAETAHDLETDIETVWDDLSTWTGIKEEIRLHERARQRQLDRAEASG